MPYRRIKNSIASFFARRLTSEVKELYSSSLILNLAFAMVAIFEPVFLYVLFIDKYGLSRTLQLILLFYLAIYLLYFAILPWGAKFARRFGYEYSLALSSVFVAIYYLCLFGAESSVWFIFGAVVLDTLWRVFYWPAYHADLARFAASGEQGRTISNLIALESFIYIIGPLVGGLILKFFGFNVLFVVVAILLIASNLPMLITKEEFTPVPFSYFNSYKRLFQRENRRRFFAHLGFGEELIELMIWPVFVFVVVKDFLGLGLFSALSTVVTTLTLLFVGRLTDKKDHRQILRLGTVLFFVAWLFKMLARAVPGVFLVDIYGRIAKQAVGIPITAHTYQKARDGSVMTTIVFFEMSLVCGKILAILLCLAAIYFFGFSWNAIFAIGAGFTLLYLLF